MSDPVFRKCGFQKVVCQDMAWESAFIKVRAKSEARPEAAIVEEITSRIPLGEIVPDEDVAEAALFLASDRARCITGQTLMVNGGEMMR